MDISEEVKFYDVCHILEKIRKVQGIKAKEQHLKKYIDSFRTYQEEFKTQHGEAANASFYCILRILIPNSDTARDSYGIQTTAMGKLYIRILSLPPNSKDALKLTYQLNSTKPHESGGDFADIVYNIIKSRLTDKSSNKTLAEIHQLLDTVAEKNIRKTEQILSKFIETSSAFEQKWLIRIIFKKLHLGIGEQRILNLYHPNAKTIYTSNTNLKNLCEQIENNQNNQNNENNDETHNNVSNVQINLRNVLPFNHIRPMLCEKLDIKKLNEILLHKTFYIETKMDGERFHLHMNNEIYKYYSRNGKDFTMNFGQTITNGNLTPILYKLFNKKINNIILDGEMMVWDINSQIYRVKGENIDVKHLPCNGNLRPCYVIYDLLYLNDICYIDKPYRERIDLLHKIVREKNGVVVYCKRERIRDIEHFRECFNEALNRDEEGVVIKEQTSTYLPGIRGGNWYKIKADYIKGLVSDFDLLIIGGFYNKAKKYINSYLVGVYKKPENSNEKSKFYSVGKISSGLSIPERIQLNECLNPHWKTNKQKNIKIQYEQDFDIIWGLTMPDVWIEPKNSIVLQIKASELSPSGSFGTSFILRFPSIQAIRNDKIWDECMTLQEYENFFNRNTGVKKINKRILSTEDFLPSKKSKSLSSHKNYLNPYNDEFKVNEVEKFTDQLNGVAFCILSGFKQKKISINDLKMIVTKHSANIIDNPIEDHNKCITVAGDITPRVKKLIEIGLYNIVSVNWLIRAFSGSTLSKKLSQIKPSDMICTTSDVDEKLKELYDLNGDSYTEKVDIAELKELLNAMDSKNIEPLTDSEMAKLEDKLCIEKKLKNIFRNVNACFYSINNDLSKILILSKLKFESRGGCNLNYNNLEEFNKIEFIIIDEYDNNEDKLKSDLYEIFQSKIKKISIVSYRWILDCNIKNEKISISNYVKLF